MDDVKKQNPEKPHVVGYMPDSPDGEPLITLESHEEFVSKLMQPGLEAWQKGRDGMREERDAQRLRADTAEAELKRLDSLDTMHLIAELTKRIAERDELIADVLKAFQLNAEGRGSCINPGITFIQPWAERVAALNQKSEGESHD